jgi:hypothetical protein
MSIKLSTGLRKAMMDTGSFKATMDGGFIKIYKGDVPANADAALGSAVLLCTITKDNDGTTGLTFATTATAGSLTKNADVWKGTNVDGGTASFYRFVKTGDSGASSTTDIRIQGLASTSGSDLVMSTTTFVFGADETINFCTYTLPGG